MRPGQPLASTRVGYAAIGPMSVDAFLSALDWMNTWDTARPGEFGSEFGLIGDPGTHAWLQAHVEGEMVVGIYYDPDSHDDLETLAAVLCDLATA